jgi:predicted Zn-dependent protease
MVNAVALPGGRILIFDGLLKQAQSPDELAGVLAHEIGHVRHRDTMAAMVRQLGLSVVLGGLDGQMGGTLNGLLAMSYSRDAERSADGYSMDALKRADVSPDGVAGFFDRMGGGKKGEAAERTMSWMASHPVSAERKSAFLKTKIKGHVYRPSLSPAQWQALLRACRDDKDVRPAVDFGL